MTDDYHDEKYWENERNMKRAEEKMRNPVHAHYPLMVAAGDRLAERETITTDIIQALNPFYTDESDEAYYEAKTARRIVDWQIANAVEYLLALVVESSGHEQADALRRELDFRAERFEDGGAYINGLDQTRWLNIADLVLIRALEVSHRGRRQREETLTAAQVEAEYGLQPGTVRQAIRTRSFPATKQGRDWMIKRSDAEKEWGKNS